MRVHRYLAANEQEVLQSRQHWVVLARVFAETFGILVAALALSGYFAARGGGVEFLVTLLWWGVLAVVVRLLWRLLDWSRVCMVITDSRMMKISGIISIKVQSIPMSKITDISYNLDPTGRLLGYGAFALETEGDHTSDLEKIEHVPHPDHFYLLLCNSIFGAAPEPAADD